MRGKLIGAATASRATARGHDVSTVSSYNSTRALGDAKLPSQPVSTGNALNRTGSIASGLELRATRYYTPTLSISRVFPIFAATSSRTGASLADVTGCRVSAWRAWR
jgi:hypothetical protein